MTIRTIATDKIHRNERQPREYFDEAALKELADSIERFGLMQPIEVRRDRDAGGYEIVAGERRWRAHQVAGIAQIKCIITDDDLSTLERFKRSVAENINRADMTPMEEAKAFRRILDDQEGAGPGDVAKEFGKSTQYVNLRLALLDLTEEVQQHVNSGAIGTQAAVQIAALTPGNQRAVMHKWAKGAFSGDNELVHFAYALKQQQNQTFALILEDMSEEEREERQRERTTTRGTGRPVWSWCVRRSRRVSSGASRGGRCRLVDQPDACGTEALDGLGFGVALWADQRDRPATNPDA